MTKRDLTHTTILSTPLRLFKMTVSLLIAAIVAIGLSSHAFASESNGTLIAYSVDYEMDKARAEKTIEHYGEGMRPIVEDALENNDDNPNSKSTAENSYERESSLNEVLPEKVGDSFSEDTLLNIDEGDGSKVR